VSATGEIETTGSRPPITVFRLVGQGRLSGRDDPSPADTGPGIDPDDLRFLFRLFFSKRVEGRGVGLYLCRANLAAGGHSIEYATEPDQRILDGANFVIRFQGLKHA